MKIICAGLPKTGTKSLAAALKILGFTVHDYEEHMEYHLNEYISQACRGIIPDFSSMYNNVDATTDTPACFFWKEIKECFPHSKVILTERDNVESWVKSVLHTHEVWEESKSVLTSLGLVITPTGRKWKKRR
ncbi:hypothetical protein AC249_AIPGENE4440 [Exaiptasia diaphana]|nr:hypothetical protein AC249_AIPGENE4440 [Exaiptasia diaphana]